MWQTAPSPGGAQEQADFLAAVADCSRLTILGILRGGEFCVTDIVKRAGGLSQPNVSKHLGVLRDRGLVRRDKRGREVFYELADGVAPFLDGVSALMARAGH